MILGACASVDLTICGDNPHASVGLSLDHDPQPGAAGQGGDRLPASEAASHEQELLAQGDQSNGQTANVWLQDYQPPALSECSSHFEESLLLIAKVVEGIDHHDAIEASRRQRQPFDLCLHGLQPRFGGGLLQHRQREVEDDDPAGMPACVLRHTPGAPAGIQQAAAFGQAEPRSHLFGMAEGRQAIVVRGEQSKMI
jgi:hypothetical protein